MKFVLFKNTFVHTQSLLIYIHTFKIKICIPCPTCSSDRILIFIQLHHFVGAIFRNGFLYKFELTMYHKKPKKQLLQEACLTEKKPTHTIISVSKAHNITKIVFLISTEIKYNILSTFLHRMRGNGQGETDC